MHFADFADSPGPDAFAEFSDRTKPVALVSKLSGQFVPAGGLGHHADFIEGVREWFFAVNVFVVNIQWRGSWLGCGWPNRMLTLQMKRR